MRFRMSPENERARARDMLFNPRNAGISKQGSRRTSQEKERRRSLKQVGTRASFDLQMVNAYLVKLQKDVEAYQNLVNQGEFKGQRFVGQEGGYEQKGYLSALGGYGNEGGYDYEGGYDDEGGYDNEGEHGNEAGYDNEGGIDDEGGYVEEGLGGEDDGEGGEGSGDDGEEDDGEGEGHGQQGDEDVEEEEEAWPAKIGGVCQYLDRGSIIPQGVLPGRIGKTFPRTVFEEPDGIHNEPFFRCYRNALLQCLMHTPEWYHLLGNVHLDCPDGPSKCITCSLQQITQEYWNGDRDSNQLDLDSDELESALKAVLVNDDSIQDDEQSDPHDLLMNFIRYIEIDAFGQDPHDGLNYVAHQLNPQDPLSTTIPQIFNLEFLVRWTCEECGEQQPEVIPPPEMGCMMSIEEEDENDSIENYLFRKTFTDKKTFKCESAICRQKQRIPGYELPMQTKHKLLARAPEVLVVRLNRTKAWYDPVQDLMVQEKRKQRMTYEEILDLSHYSPSGESIRYQLRGVISHVGPRADRGHYVAQVKPRGDGAGYACISDEDVKSRSYLRPTEGDPYVWIYSRM